MVDGPSRQEQPAEELHLQSEMRTLPLWDRGHRGTAGVDHGRREGRVVSEGGASPVTRTSSSELLLHLKDASAEPGRLTSLHFRESQAERGIGERLRPPAAV